METRHDPNGLTPHTVPSDIQRVAWGGLIRQRRPEHSKPNQTENDKPEGIDYSLLFELMKSTEKAHEYLTTPGATLPSFGLEGWKIERDMVISEIIESKKIVSRLISPATSVPIHFEDESGQVLRGQITAFRDFTDGCWELELLHDNSPRPITVFKTSEQLRTEYLAATAVEQDLLPTEEFDS